MIVFCRWRENLLIFLSCFVVFLLTGLARLLASTLPERMLHRQLSSFPVSGRLELGATVVRDSRYRSGAASCSVSRTIKLTPLGARAQRGVFPQLGVILDFR